MIFYLLKNHFKSIVTSLLTLCIFSLSVPSVLANKVIKVPERTPAGSNTALDTLLKIVEIQGEGYTVEYPFQGQGRPSFAKQIADFEAGALDVIWTLANRKYETEYQAIYYPLYYGMFGMRLPIVKSENRNMLAGVRNLEDLKQFKVGQGLGWADTDILKANGLNVVAVTKYHNHFPMLEGERFDLFPRAVHEPWNEVKNNAEYNLVVDEHVLIRYRVGFYFFVNRDNRVLIDYLNRGMKLLEENGEHKKIFLADEEVQMAFNNGNLDRRVIIDLDNPELTNKNPGADSELWLNLENLDAWIEGEDPQGQAGDADTSLSEDVTEGEDAF